MSLARTADLWWKTAVVYCLDVETFADSDGDGCGDLPGLVSRLDHLAELGVTCLWLMPFYPTPDRDDGYDITDFYGVDPRLGTHGDVVEMVRSARDRGMRVIVDLVVNHTSDKHPWFRAARGSRTSPYRDFYIWADTPPPDADEGVVFPDAEDSTWTLDEKSGQHYKHQFYRHQPDLNVENPRVREEIAKVMGFWLALGISGFRVDAVPFLLDAPPGGALPDPHDYLADLRAFLGRRNGDAVLLGEVNLPYADQMAYFGEPAADGAPGSSELTMQFDFVGMQQMYLSLARGDARPLRDTLAARPATDPDSQWATFVRNHDELTLDKLTDAERAEVFAAFGPQESMQLFGRGLRRRLPPMLEGDPRRIRMVYSLAFSLPGTPVLFYGEEIGMGENLDVPGRMSVRTPMQWTAGPGAGFSTATASRLCVPIVTGGFGPEFVNVEDQRDDPDSLLTFIGTLVRRYRERPELGWGTFELLDQPHDAVLAHRSTWEGASTIALHNLGAEPVVVPLRLPDLVSGHLQDLLERGVSALDGRGGVQITLEGYGYRWLRAIGG